MTRAPLPSRPTFMCSSPDYIRLIKCLLDDNIVYYMVVKEMLGLECNNDHIIFRLGRINNSKPQFRTFILGNRLSTEYDCTVNSLSSKNTIYKCFIKILTFTIV